MNVVFEEPTPGWVQIGDQRWTYDRQYEVYRSQCGHWELYRTDHGTRWRVSDVRTGRMGFTGHTVEEAILLAEAAFQELSKLMKAAGR